MQLTRSPATFSSCACKRSSKLYKKGHEAQLSHRKLCSWNASSAAFTLLWLCDITPRHTLHNLCRAAIFACKNWFSTAALLMLAMQLRRVWTNQSQQTGHSGRGRALKRQELKTERFKQRGNAELQHWTVWQNWCVFWALRHATCSSSD